jgi:VCBS repeat-containing protein
LLSVHIEGTNDAAVMTGSSSANIIESDSVQSVSGQLRSFDIDNLSTFNAQDDIAGNHGYGHFSIDTSGFWTYTLDNAQDQLVGGQSYTDSATVTSIDGTQQVITVHVSGTNQERDAGVTASGALSSRRATCSTDVGATHRHEVRHHHMAHDCRSVDELILRLLNEL